MTLTKIDHDKKTVNCYLEKAEEIDIPNLDIEL